MMLDQTARKHELGKARTDGIALATWALCTAIIGYYTLSRGFAYIGFSRFNLFIGEFLLVCVIVSLNTRLLRVWFGGLLGRTPYWRLSWALFLLILVGIIAAFRGLDAGRPQVLSVLRDSVFVIYPFYVLVGVVVGRTHPRLVTRMVRILAWSNGTYGISYLLLFSRLHLALPGGDVSLLSQPSGSSVALLGLIAFWRPGRTSWFLAFLNLLVMLALQVRAEWLGFAFGLAAILAVRGKFGVLVRAIVPAFLVMAILSLSGLSIQVPGTHGGVVSAANLASRVVAPINVAAARRLSSRADTYAGTVSWRIEWWRAIWQDSSARPSRFLFGRGFGFPIASLVSYVPEDVHTPHSVFFFALDHTGWSGVVAFLAVVVSLVALAARASRRYSSFALGLVVSGVVAGMFSNFFATPFGAIPYFALVGMTIGNDEVWCQWKGSGSHFVRRGGQTRVVHP